MDFADTAEESELRSELRSLLDEHVPEAYLGAFTHNENDLAVAQNFCKVLAQRRLLALAWPEEFGGRAGNSGELTVLREEMWARHEPRGAQYMGVNWIGPAIMRFGTPAQQELHLPPISAGEVIWCQGFSEPDSGSDLASLKTAARPVKGGWEVNGQKVWTSYATMAEWIFLLARTSNTGPKQQGITVFLVPMSRPGIEVRPIPAMLGPHHLNEVFLSGVQVTEADVLGTVGQGWQVVREALAFERVGIARYARCERLLNEAPDALGDRWARLPGALKHRWVKALVHTRQARLLAHRVVERHDTGVVDPRDSAAYRIAVTRLDQEVGEVLMDVIGSDAVGTDDETDLFSRAVEDHWRYAQASTVASGSIEMQRVLLSRALLGEAAR
ncbi:MAG: acyl-CoA dehydrogenase protein [Jatrophihabitans sp.]|nr:acyl-CoA dehydrogenase protein [Jatrophihabitans sp.]